MIDKLKKDIHDSLKKFMRLEDSPHNISLGFSVGVFLGILPFTGVLAAIAVAWYFKLNKPAAILGSFLTNTWLGFIILGISIHLSCQFLGVSYAKIKAIFEQFFKDFHWEVFGDALMLKILAAVAFGYLILSLLLSLMAYFACLAYIHYKKRPVL